MKHLFRTTIIAATLAAASAPHAATVDLTGAGFVTYGDAQSYSLPANGLEVMAGPGQIDIFTKLGLGANGQLGNNTPGMDDAYDTPQANPIDGFRMSAGNEPNGVEGSWDREAWWDTTLSALDTSLDLTANSIVFFFANNETGGAGTDNLAAWARLELTRISDGASLGFFEFTNDQNHDGSSDYGPPIPGSDSGIPLGDVTAFTSLQQDPVLADFVQSGGEICTDINGFIVDCAGPGVENVFEHNLGGDRAAYALVLPELDALIAGLVDGGADLSDYALHVEYRLGCGPEDAFPEVIGQGGTICDPNYALNGGDEKVFLGTQLRDVTVGVPEPASLLLAATALLAVATVRRRRQDRI
ncbi:MAG: PEP-CTERM sorting domain-containing protein [Rhodocyclaceae bacterium]|nr:PEP-CTERM sorting domain-containing protein [Rhodocyclaceae bacterium]